MDTLADFGQVIVQIREAVNSIETKGRANAAFVVYACNKCDELIEALNSIVRDAEEETDGDSIEQDSGLPE